MNVKYLLAAAAATTMLVTASTAVLAGASGVPFKSAGFGTETSLSASGCQFTAAGCTVESNGTAISSYMGTGPYVSTLTVDWAAATSNGDGGYCAPASGTQGMISGANGDTLYQSETGTVCEVGASSLTAPHTFSGTFTITGGTGRFAAASGSGTVTGGDDGYGNSYYSETGTISF